MGKTWFSYLWYSTRFVYILSWIKGYYCFNLIFIKGTSDEHLTIVRLLRQIKPDGAILVSTPQKLSMDAVKKELTFCKKMSLKVIGIVENMSYFVCPCCSVI